MSGNKVSASLGGSKALAGVVMAALSDRFEVEVTNPNALLVRFPNGSIGAITCLVYPPEEPAPARTPPSLSLVTEPAPDTGGLSL